MKCSCTSLDCAKAGKHVGYCKCKTMNNKDKYNSHVALIMRYEDDCNWIAREFTEKYFDKESAGDVEEWWVGGTIGSVIYINDFYFSMEEMVLALSNKVSSKSLFLWYEQWTDCNNYNRINLKSWIGGLRL